MDPQEPQDPAETVDSRVLLVPLESPVTQVRPDIRAVTEWTGSQGRPELTGVTELRETAVIPAKTDDPGVSERREVWVCPELSESPDVEVWTEVRVTLDATESTGAQELPDPRETGEAPAIPEHPEVEVNPDGTALKEN